MPIQSLNSQNSLSLNSVLKGNYKRPHGSSYHDLLVMQNQNFKKQIDHFLKFSKMPPSQNLSTALGILEGKSIDTAEDCDSLDCSPEDVKLIRQIFDYEGRVVHFISSDGTINYKLSYEGNVTTIINQVAGEVHLQETDDQGRLVREVFPCGLEISWKFGGDFLSEVTLPDQSKVVYQYLDQDHVNIQRLSPNGKVQYQHAYEAKNDNLIQEVLIGKAGSLQRQYDETSKTLTTKSASLCVVDQFDEDRNLISRTFKDPAVKDESTTLNYPAGDLIVGEKRQLDDLGRVIYYDDFICSYDEKGRLLQKSSESQTINYRYDAFDRLISAEMGNKKIEYTYDLSGRRVSKTVAENGKTHKEFYLYQGVNQIGVYNENRESVHLKVLGAALHTHLPFAIAVESQGKIYAPIYSSNYNVLQLIDQDSKEVIHYESLNPFGENLQNLDPICPWIFATKHYDSDTGLVDFGDRQYDPTIKQWTSPDSDPRAAEEDLYSYCNNNPLKYIDPNGQWRINFGFAIPLGVGAARGAASGAAGGPLGILLGILAGAAIGLAVDAVQKKINDDKMGDNGRPNKQYKDAAKEVEKKLGRKLTPEEFDQFHDLVTGQGYGYHEMAEEGFHLFDDRYRNN